MFVYHMCRLVYVEDFKLADWKDNIQVGRNLIRGRLNVGPPTKLGVFLACNHFVRWHKQADGQELTVINYDMIDFMRSCAACYQELCPSARLKTVDAPFFPEDQNESPYTKPLAYESKGIAE